MAHILRPIEPCGDDVPLIVSRFGFVYLGQDHGIVAIPKAGGAVRPIFQGSMTRPLGGVAGLSGDSLYFLEREEHPVPLDARPATWTTMALRRVASTGGPPVPAVWMREWRGAFATNGTDLYWTQASIANGSEIRRASTVSVSSIISTGGPTNRLDRNRWGVPLLFTRRVAVQNRSSESRPPETSETLVINTTLTGDRTIAVGGGKLVWAAGGGSIIRSRDL